MEVFQTIFVIRKKYTEYGNYRYIIYSTPIFHHEISFFLFTLYIFKGKLNTAVLDGIYDLPSIVAVPVYDTKPINFLLMCCNTIKWVQKTWQMYDPETKMLRDHHFLRLDVHDS